MRHIFLLLIVLLISAPAVAGDNARTSGRTLDGKTIYPAHLFAKPEFDEFLPHNSNHDPHHQHPQQWQGQDWDTKAWRRSGWTAENTLNGFFQNDIFRDHFIRGGQENSAKVAGIPVLVLGPTFYKLSDLDQRRSVKLAVDQAGLFNQGYVMVELQDWYNKKAVGSYTPRGLFMN